MKNIQNIREQRFLTAAVQNTKKLAASSPPSFPDFSFQSPALLYLFLAANSVSISALAGITLSAPFL